MTILAADPLCGIGALLPFLVSILNCHSRNRVTKAVTGSTQLGTQQESGGLRGMRVRFGIRMPPIENLSLANSRKEIGSKTQFLNLHFFPRNRVAEFARYGVS